MNNGTLTIGSRGSQLAMWQSRWVRDHLIAAAPGLEVEIERIVTKGDRILDVPLAKVGGKGLFVKEIEEALLRGDIDIAVHSMKDVPSELPEGLHIGAVCERDDPRDVFVSNRYAALDALPEGARVGTSSLRRGAQILRRKPMIEIVELRGNVDTRLRKLEEQGLDGIVLAAAGLRRLGLTDRITEPLGPDTCLPAIGQGAVGIECRIDDPEVNRVVSCLDHAQTAIAVRAERSFLAVLQGGCQIPVGALARAEAARLTITGMVARIDGQEKIIGQKDGLPSEAVSIGAALAHDILDRGGREILEEIYGKYEG